MEKHEERIAIGEERKYLHKMGILRCRPVRFSKTLYGLHTIAH